METGSLIDGRYSFFTMEKESGTLPSGKAGLRRKPDQKDGVLKSRRGYRK